MPATTSQLALDGLVQQDEGLRNLAGSFRRLYYRIYTNSKASRAERIMEDLSLLLLAKLASEADGGYELSSFLSGAKHATESLLPLLLRTYPDLVEPGRSLAMGEDAARSCLQELNSVSLSTAPAHVLGEAFQALIGPRLRGDKGQFFTPRSLVRSMVKIVAPLPHQSVLDPACGTGGFLAEAYTFQATSNSEPTGRLTGIDKDHDLYLLASALLQVATGGRARVLNFDSLDARRWQDHASGGQDELYDVVLTNPPFGAKIGVVDHFILKSFALGHQWIEHAKFGRWHQSDAVLASQDPQTLFLELCVRKLKPGGRMGIVLPEGLFGNRGSGYVWEWLLQEGTILALLDCPRTTFQPGTDTKTNVLFFEKHLIRRPASVPIRSWVGVALHCGHDRRGRTHRADGTPLPDDFAHLGKTFSQRASNGQSAGWYPAVLRPDYLVPRYYAKTEGFSEEVQIIRGAERVLLGDLVSAHRVEIRKGHEVGSHVYGSGEIPFVRTSDLSNLEVKADPTVGVSEEVYEVYRSQQKLRPGDILMVVDGRYKIGTSAILTEHNYRCVIQSHLRAITIKHLELLDPHELLFALNLPSVRYQIRSLVFVQSTLGTLGKRLLELEIPILHGPGPWADRINRFRGLLEARDRSLSEMRAMMAPDLEL